MRDFTPIYVKNGNVRLASYEAQPPANVAHKGAILLVHGWPELAYSWRHQMGPLAAAGYHVIAPDLRGFGHSDAPPEVEAYRIDKMVSDIAAVLDHYGYEQAVICGHDWGGIIVWHAARMLAPRVSKVISICTPHVRLAPIDPIDIFRKRFGDEHYFVHFTERPGEADALFAADPDAFFRLMFRKGQAGTKIKSDMTHIPARFKAYLDAGAPDLGRAAMRDAERAVYVKAYQKSGFTGGINLYRNTTANWEIGKTLPAEISQPSLMLSADNDLFLPPSAADQMVETVPNLTRVTLAQCGHWAMSEQPEAVTTAMLDWLCYTDAGKSEDCGP